jgi:c-di-GMP-binding flagellar brake protein YcgR
MMERRAYERFQLALPARLEVVSSGREEVFEARTRDISANGVFLFITAACSVGSKVRLDLAVRSKRIAQLTGAQGLIKVEGKVVRSDPEGIAISFDQGVRILGLRTS